MTTPSAPTHETCATEIGSAVKTNCRTKTTRTVAVWTLALTLSIAILSASPGTASASPRTASATSGTVSSGSPQYAYRGFSGGGGTIYNHNQTLLLDRG